MNQIWPRCSLVILLISLMSCSNPDPNKQVDEGNVTDNTYTSHEIGWTIEIPGGWEVISKDVLEEIDDVGMELLEETIGQPVDTQGLKHLISFQKNESNSLMSTSEPFVVDYPGEYEENNTTLKQILLETYRNNGIKVDVSDTETVKIDGLDFITFQFQLYGPDGNVVLTQRMYSRLIKGYDFGVTMNYNNEVDRDEMMAVWRQSKFSK